MGSEKFKKIKKTLLYSVIFLLLVGGPTVYGIYNIFQPQHYPVKFFRGEVVKVTDQILVGPYPTEKEFIFLKKQGITEIISLLDPKMPFESSLIEQEKELAVKQNLTFRNVPLAYLPNLESKENMMRVADLVRYTQENPGMKYIHCYLGRHRTTLFKEQYIRSVAMPSG